MSLCRKNGCMKNAYPGQIYCSKEHAPLGHLAGSGSQRPTASGRMEKSSFKEDGDPLAQSLKEESAIDSEPENQSMAKNSNSIPLRGERSPEFRERANRKRIAKQKSKKQTARKGSEPVNVYKKHRDREWVKIKARRIKHDPTYGLDRLADLCRGGSADLFDLCQETSIKQLHKLMKSVATGFQKRKPDDTPQE